MSTWTDTLATLLSGNKTTGTWADNWYRLLKAISDPWSTYSPTWSGGSPAIGNGTLTGSYIQVGKLLLFRINWVSGSTTTYGSGAYTFGNLPANSNEPTGSAIGYASINDTSVTTDRQGGWVAWQNGANGVGLGDLTARRVGAAVPQTFATGDQITVKGIYETV